MASLVPGVHYTTDEYRRDVELTDAGFERVEGALGAAACTRPARSDCWRGQLRAARAGAAAARRGLHRARRPHRDRGRVHRRVMPDRHWPDGLQAALEAKEGLRRRPDGQVLASMTLQRFLRGYGQLCGMTGTARTPPTSSRVLRPRCRGDPHAPSRARLDRPDLVFTHREAKEEAVAGEVQRTHATGRPVLVGTLTVEESERLGTMLRARGVPCHVLNAKEDEDEARIVASAGAPGAVTIATNMAGRGTDIRLGDDTPGSAERVAALAACM
jgi:preprotein translocase subunit SecA